MKRFFALFHKDEDSAFCVQFPDFESLFSAAHRENNLNHKYNQSFKTLL